MNIVNIIQERLHQKKNLYFEIWETFRLCSEQSKYIDSLISRTEKLNLCNKSVFLDICIELFNQFKEDINTDVFEIPVIVYSGDVDALPLIFEKINSTGTKLSQFDVFAAMWSKYEYN